MPAKRQRLFLIDGYSNIFRAYYAIRGLSNSKGEPTNAVYGFVTMLRKLLKDESPELVGVALDVSHRTVRTEKYEDYKANRTPMPDDLKQQMPWIRRALEAHKIPALELEKYEADDVLGTLAKKATAAGYEVVLVSADKDLMQLVGDGVSLQHTGREKLYDPKLVEEDFGVPPEKVVDVLALKGDSVDNVPGVPGIGEKGAQQLVREYGSLEELLERAGEVKRKSYREGLEEHREQALLSKELVTIHTDLDIEFEPDKLKLEKPDPDELKKLYRELEFFSLVEELEAGGGDVEVEAAQELATAAAFGERVKGLSGEVVLAAVGPEPPVGLALAGADGPVALADFRRDGVREAAVAWLEKKLADPKAELLGHDLKEVLRLTPAGRAARAKLFDTMLVSYVLQPSMHGHSLEQVALDRLGYKALANKEAGWDKGEAPQPGQEPLLVYAAERIEVPRRLRERLAAELGDGALAAVYREIEAPLVPVLVGMEEEGVELDTGYLEEMSRELGGELLELEKEIYDLAGEKFNVNSPRQLGSILFEKLGYPVLKKTKKTKSYSTSAETLQELALRGYDLPDRVLRYRELSKLKSTYVDALPPLVGKDGRLHTRYDQAVAATGRLSSANPNLQNIPVRTEQGLRIRKAFRAPKGRLLLVADYSQVELRILAHIAEEPALLEAFAAGEDIHRATAASVFGVARDLVTPDQRRAAKTINFGIIYGISPFGLAANLGIPQKEAKKFIDAYLERYAGVKRYMDDTLEAAQETLQVETLYGRVRKLPEIKARNFAVRENAKRMAINARIQGTAADILKKAMIALDARLRDEHPKARLLLTVHDELVLEVPESDVEPVGEVVREAMEGVIELRAPLVVDLGWGRTWYDAKA